MESVIKKKYEISGWSGSLEEAVTWAKEKSEHDDNNPDIVLINGLDHYRRTWKHKEEANKILTDYLQTIKQYLPDSHIKIFLPEEKNTDQELLINLMQQAIYDFWFIDNINEEELLTMLSLNRTFADVEKYLNTLPLPVLSGSNEARLLTNNIFRPLIFFRQQKSILNKTQGIKEGLWDRLWPKKAEVPFNDRSDENMIRRLQSIDNPIRAGTAFFWSEDDCLLTYGIAFLLAYFLAASGYKTVLAEVPGRQPRLGISLGIRHPFWNVRSALSKFALEQSCRFNKFVFNGKAFRNSREAYDRHHYVKNYPDLLYFFPDGSEEEWPKEEELKNKWESFMISWLQWAMFQENFQFIIFCGFGHSFYQDVVLKRVAYLKALIAHPWAGGFKLAQEAENMWPGKNLFLWSHPSPSLKKETKKLPRKQCFQVPYTIYTDFINITSFLQPPDELQAESAKFLEKVGQSFINSFFIPVPNKIFFKRLKQIF